MTAASSPPPVGTTEIRQQAREDRGVAAGLVRRARAANSDDEVDAARDAIAREIATERALAARPAADPETLRNLLAQWSYERSPWFPALPWAEASENLRGAFLRPADRFLASSPVRAALGGPA